MISPRKEGWEHSQSGVQGMYPLAAGGKFIFNYPFKSVTSLGSPEENFL